MPAFVPAHGGDQRRDVGFVVGQNPQDVQPARGAEEPEKLGCVIENVSVRGGRAGGVSHRRLPLVD